MLFSLWIHYYISTFQFTFITFLVVFRYNILAAAAVASAKNDKAAAKSLFEIVGLEAEKYRLGHTKASNDYIPLCKSR